MRNLQAHKVERRAQLDAMKSEVRKMQESQDAMDKKKAEFDALLTVAQAFERGMI